MLSELPANLGRPNAIQDWHGAKLGWIETSVPNRRPTASVSDVHHSFVRLNAGGITEFSPIVFKNQGALPVDSVLGERHIQWATHEMTMVVHQKLPPILQSDRVSSRVWVWEIRKAYPSPGSAKIVGADVEYSTIFGASDGQQLLFTQS